MQTHTAAFSTPKPYSYMYFQHPHTIRLLSAPPYHTAAFSIPIPYGCFQHPHTIRLLSAPPYHPIPYVYVFVAGKECKETSLKFKVVIMWTHSNTIRVYLYTFLLPVMQREAYQYINMQEAVLSAA